MEENPGAGPLEIGVFGIIRLPSPSDLLAVVVDRVSDSVRIACDRKSKILEKVVNDVVLVSYHARGFCDWRQGSTTRQLER